MRDYSGWHQSWRDVPSSKSPRQDLGRSNHAEGDLARGEGGREASRHQEPCTPWLAPYLRGLCHLAGGELEQIQFLLGHASVETTERYLGCKQKLSHAVNDNLGLEDT